MRPSLRFLALCVAGWAGFRAYTLGAIPAGSLSLIPPSEAKTAPPPIVATEFPAIDPPPPAPPAAYPQAVPYAVPQVTPMQIRPVMVPVYYPAAGPVSAPAARANRLTNILPEPAAPIYASNSALDEWPLSRLASESVAQARSSVVVTAGQSTPVWIDRRTNRLDRLQASAWAMLRGQQGQPLGPTSLASGGQLGGSQAGARVIYNLTRQIAASLRTSSDVGRRGGEVAAGMRVQPVAGIPVWLTAERRQQIGRYGGGRNAFAIFAEGGVYQRPMPGRFSLEAYLQGGMVGVRSRDAFVDGALTLTRPIFKRFSAGFGLWGGAQPGIYRVDAGPRISMQVRKNVRVHFDWRQKLAGNAQPGSGPAVTLASDF